MTLFEKGAIFLVIAGFIVVSIFNIATEFSGPRTILIKKENSYKAIDSVTHDSLVYNYSKQFRTYEAFHVKVKAKTFWDKILLTNEDGNLMCELFKIALCVALAWYVYQLQLENIFSRKSFNIIWLSVMLFVGIIESLAIGADYTRYFWRDYFISKGGNELIGYDFFGDTRIPWTYMWIIMPFGWLYRALKGKHEEKLKQEKKGNEGLSTIN